MSVAPNLIIPQGAVYRTSFLDLTERAKMLGHLIRSNPLFHTRNLAARPLHLYGIPRGGVPAALLVDKHLELNSVVTADPEQADVYIDDLIDSGRTRERIYNRYGPKPFLALFDKTKEDLPWIVFPWEGSEEGSADDIPIRLLQYIGEDPHREGLAETPRRFLAAWKEWCSGYGQEERLTVFADGAEKYDELVIVKDIPVYSHCEHHLAPFFGKAHIGYLPRGKIVGLSKLARLTQVFAKRLQVQERLTSQIAHALQEALTPVGVGVVLECRHLCMESRGVRTPGAATTTSRLLGALKDQASARAEFLRLVR